MEHILIFYVTVLKSKIIEFEILLFSDITIENRVKNCSKSIIIFYKNVICDLKIIIKSMSFRDCEKEEYKFW